MSKPYGTIEILEREIANLGNEIKRHCRVVNVRPKAKPFKYEDIMRPDPVLPMAPWIWTQGGGFVPNGSSADVPPFVPAHGVML